MRKNAYLGNILLAAVTAISARSQKRKEAAK